jgi:glycosyltransferase involved in cell wall biosynthesis
MVMERFRHAGLLARLALTAQRLGIRLPGALLRPLRSWLVGALGEQAGERGIEDWSGPLIAGREPAGEGRGSEPRAALEAAGPPAADGPPEQPADGLRCLLVTSALDVGGLDEVVVFLARRLPRRGIRTAVLHASEKGAPDGVPSGRLGRLLREQGVETVELANGAGARWLEAWRPDVISAHGAPPWVLDAAGRLAVPYVDTLHGMHSHFAADWRSEAERGRRLAGIVAVSDLVRRQYLAGNPGFPRERIVTIANGVDDQRRLPCDRDEMRARLGLRAEYLFVSLARHCLQKNTYGLVAAFGEVAARYPEAHLVIAGQPVDPLYFAQVLRLRAGLACRDRIHLRHHTPNPAALLAAADGFVLDSFFEGWPLASMEALYAGVPVVLSEVGGAGEQVGAGGERGRVVPNPLGDPWRVNWTTMREACYGRQANREALVAAMGSLIERRAFWAAARQRLAGESGVRFHPDRCLASHAQVLAAAARGAPLRYGADAAARTA